MQFENAIDSQRYTQRKLDLESSTCLPSFRTPFEVEKQCASVFTLSVFYDLQVEIYDSVFNCVITGFIKEGDIHYYHVRLSCGKVITVNHSTSSDDLLCSCNKFLNVGLPCSHMFTVLRTIGSDFLPEKYINARWTKKSSLKPTFIINDVVVKEAVEMDEKKTLVSELLSEMHECVNIIEDDVDCMKDFLGLLRNKKSLYIQSMSKLPAPTQQSSQLSRFEKFTGPLPTQVDILPPPQSKNKGRPRQKRIQGVVEKIMTQSSKEKRCCTICNHPGHNSRTCKKEKLP